MKHSCDAEIRKNPWALSGYRQPGDRWTCSCGATFVHVCDEADGCSWEPIVVHLAARHPGTGLYGCSYTPLVEKATRCMPQWDGSGRRTLRPELVTCEACK